MKTLIPCIVVTLVMCMSSWVRAQPTTRPEGFSVPTETRVYNVAGLLTQMQNYPIQKEAKFELPPDRSTQLVESLIVVIQNTVKPEGWRDNGGDEGSIRVFNDTLLIVVAPTETHTAVQKLLDQLQRESTPARMVRIDASWLLLSADELKQINSIAKGGDVDHATLIVPDAIVDRAIVYSRGQTTGFDKQTVHIKSGVQRSYIAALHPIVGSGAVGYDAQLNTVNDGVSLQLRPQLVVGENSAVLDVMSEVSEVQAGSGLATTTATTRPTVAASNPEYAVEVSALGLPDRLNVLSQQFHTTVRLPIGENVIVGGMSLEPTTRAGGLPRNLYLIVRVSASPK